MIASREASGDGAFLRLRSTDTVLLQAVSPDALRVTVDLDLYLAASAHGDERAINCNHLRFAKEEVGGLAGFSCRQKPDSCTTRADAVARRDRCRRRAYRTVAVFPHGSVPKRYTVVVA